MCYFIDDMHLPRLDAQGEQSTLELMRHVLDRGHWFDRDSCQERTIHKCTFIGAMSPSHVATAARARFIRHFSPVLLHDPAPHELQNIYESLSSSLFRSLNDDELVKLAQPLVRCTIKQLTGLSSVLMPSHEKPHYLFSQHEIAKVFHGLFKNADLCTSPLQTSQLWLFLCKSTFMGRLVSQVRPNSIYGAPRQPGAAQLSRFSSPFPPNTRPQPQRGVYSVSDWLSKRALNLAFA